MLSFLHLAALWTLAALALPLVIHLRRPPPRTVRLGSLRFLENAPRRPWRNPRWREWLLLAIRLGLLAALALLLAEPRWIDAPPAGPRRWALLDPTAALTGDALARWRGLKADGFEFRRLSPGFPAVNDEPNSGSGDHATPDLWSLLREADAQLPAGSVLAVFSPGRLAALRGDRPVLGHCKVEWIATADTGDGQPHVWVASGWKDRVVAGRSDARSTTFAVAALRAPFVFPTHEDEHWRTDPGDDRPGATPLLHDDSPDKHAADLWALEPPPPAVSVLILHDDEHTIDARYIEAAVRAAADASGRPVNVRNQGITPDAENAAATNWLFWLSTRPVPDGLAARAPRIVRYAGGDAVAADGRIAAPTGDAVDGIRLRKRALPAGPRTDTTVWWNDGQGNPVLTHSHPASGEVWELYTRLDPEWTDLPRTTALSASMRAWLFPETAAPSATNPIHDRRLADPSQGLPSEAGVVTTFPTLPLANPPSRDLRWPLWIVAALLFVAERLLSLRRPSVPPTMPSTRRPEPVAASR